MAARRSGRLFSTATRFYVSSAFQAHAQKHIRCLPLWLPPNTTDSLQPLDIAINAQIKRSAKAWRAEYLGKKAASALASGVAPSQLHSIFDRRLLTLKAPYVDCLAAALADIGEKTKVTDAAWSTLRKAPANLDAYYNLALSRDDLWGDAPQNNTIEAAGPPHQAAVNHVYDHPTMSESDGESCDVPIDWGSDEVSAAARQLAGVE